MRHVLTIGIAVLAILPKAWAGAPSEARLNQMASSGSIQQNAPVKTSLEITINAPREKVWKLLTGVNDWPSWNHEIAEAKISGPMQQGSEFVWKTSGANIHSSLALVSPHSALAWTGKAYGIEFIHQWKLQKLTGDRTLVQTEESADGHLVTVLYSSKRLQTTDQQWLDDLKRAAER